MDSTDGLLVHPADAGVRALLRGPRRPAGTAGGAGRCRARRAGPRRGGRGARRPPRVGPAARSRCRRPPRRGRGPGRGGPDGGRAPGALAPAGAGWRARRARRGRDRGRDPRGHSPGRGAGGQRGRPGQHPRHRDHRCRRRGGRRARRDRRRPSARARRGRRHPPGEPAHRSPAAVLRHAGRSRRPRAAWAASDPLVTEIHRSGVPHLVATVRGQTGIVGPLVVPGVTSCLRCADLHRRDADPRWPGWRPSSPRRSRHRAAPP